jgi:hypothetical protein
MRRTASFGIGALTLLLALSHASAAGDPYAAAIERATRNASTKAGKAYVDPLVKSLGPTLEEALKHCFPKTEETVPMRFTMVLLVNHEGTLSDKLVQPNNDKTQCVLAGIRSAHVATPPEPNWWVMVHMKIDP